MADQKNSNIFRTEYTNEFGEIWVFEYDQSSGKAILKGSDVDWQEHEVKDGRVPGLILSDAELTWLRKTWNGVTMN